MNICTDRSKKNEKFLLMIILTEFLWEFQWEKYQNVFLTETLKVKGAGFLTSVMKPSQ